LRVATRPLELLEPLEPEVLPELDELPELPDDEPRSELDAAGASSFGAPRRVAGRVARPPSEEPPDAVPVLPP
jgi:hypothetical protein